MLGTAGTAFTIAGTVNFTGASELESLTVVANTAAYSLTLNASAAIAGIWAVDLSGDTNTTGDNVINVSAFSTDTTLTGSAGADTITGGDGNDTFIYASLTEFAADSIVGGAGTLDTLTFSSGTTSISTNITLADASFARTSGLERITIGNSSANNSITLTNAQATIMVIDLSNDTDSVGGSTVDVSALTRAVSLAGSAGADSIVGGTGMDSITGGGGADTITGGVGADSIDLADGGTAVTDRVILNQLVASDTISNFTAGTTNGDILEFDLGTYTNLLAFDGTPVVPAAMAVTQIVNSPVSLIGNGNLIMLSGNFSNVQEATRALEMNGSRQVLPGIAGSTVLPAGSQFMVVWDDDSHTYVGVYTTGRTITPNSQGFSGGSLTQIAQLSGLPSVNSFTNSNFSYFRSRRSSTDFDP